MGCAGNKLCTPEQQNEVFVWATREIMILCIRAAVNSPESVQAPPPPALEEVNGLLETLRIEASKEQEAVDAQDAQRSNVASAVEATANVQGGDEEPEAVDDLDGEIDPIKPDDGAEAPTTNGTNAGSLMKGALGGMFQKLGKVKPLRGMTKKVDEAKIKAQNIIQQVLEPEAEPPQKIETPFIDASLRIEAALDGLRKLFINAGQDVVRQHKDDVVNSFTYTIRDLSLDDPVDLLRGKARTSSGPDRQDACSSYLGQFGTKALVATVLSTPAADAVKHHAVSKAWSGLIDAYNEGNQLLEPREDLQSCKRSPIKIDPVRHVIEVVVAQLCQLMGQAEGTIRADPAGKSSKFATNKSPQQIDTFCFCLTGYKDNKKLIPIYYWEDISRHTKESGDTE